MTVNILGYAGLIPFATTAGLIWLEIVTPTSSVLVAFSNYSALILSFLAGILWGRSLDSGKGQKQLLTLLSSNAFVLLAWFALLLVVAIPAYSLALLAIGYVILLAIERSLFDTLFAGISQAYKYFRFSLTMLVIAAHILIILALIR